MKLQVEPPEKKRKTKNSSPPPEPLHLSSFPSFSLLPDEILTNCLARISRSYYPTLSIVSKSFRRLLSSKELYAARSRLGSTEQCLYLSLWDSNHQFPQWFTLWKNPNPTLPNSSMTKKKKKKKKTTGHLLVPIPSCNISNSSVAVVGSEIYLIGGQVDGALSSAVRILDCRSHTWRDAPSMNVARECTASCFYNRKIYAMGGCSGLEEDESWAEVFDTKTQIWECLPNPCIEIRKCYFFSIEEIEGKINFGNNFGNNFAYDPKQGKWECSENGDGMYLRLQCVMENVSYSCNYSSLDWPFRCWWFDIKVRTWKEIKGLDSFREKRLRKRGDIGTSKLVSSYGGKLLLIWEEFSKHSKKIWCAEIMLEKDDGGELWGKIVWVDVVHTIPTSRYLQHFLVVSI